MSQRVLIVTNSDSVDDSDRNKVTELIQAGRRRGWRFWHWLPDLWLVIGPAGSIDATELRESIAGVLPRKGIYIVFEMARAASVSGRFPFEGMPWLTHVWLNGNLRLDDYGKPEPAWTWPAIKLALQQAIPRLESHLEDLNHTPPHGGVGHARGRVGSNLEKARLALQFALTQHDSDEIVKFIPAPVNLTPEQLFADLEFRFLRPRALPMP